MPKGAEFFNGRTLRGEFHLVEPLGAGAFGIAFKAFQLNSLNPVAVKIRNEDANPLAVAAFAKEAIALSHLTHPNIVPYRDFDVQQIELFDNRSVKSLEHYPFFVMAYANRGDVSRLKPKTSYEPVPPEQVIEILLQAAKGVQFAHDANNPVVHRDLKPENLLLHQHPNSNHLDVWVADFGIAIAAHRVSSAPDHGIGGTPMYMAPEVFDRKKGTGKESDQYSLAVVAYELLTGRLPFEQKTFDALDKAHTNDDPPKFYDSLKKSGREKLMNLTLEAAQQVVERALAKNPQDRFHDENNNPSIYTFAQTLKDAVDQAGGKVNPQYPGVDIPGGGGNKPLSPKGEQQSVQPIIPTDPEAGIPTKPSTPPVQPAIGEPQTPPQPVSPPEQEENRERLIRFMHEAYELLENRKNEEALKVCEQALILYPNNSDVWGRKGWALHNLSRYEEALFAFKKAHELNPIENLDRGIIPLVEGKIQVVNRMESENLARSADELFKNRQFEEALEAYERALALNPEFKAAWNNKGNTLEELKRHDEALKAYEEALRLDPKYSLAWNNKGSTLNELKRFDEALEAFNKALELNPNYKDVHFNKGIVLTNLKRYEEALTAFKKAQELNPSDTHLANIIQRLEEGLQEENKKDEEQSPKPQPSPAPDQPAQPPVDTSYSHHLSRRKLFGELISRLTIAGCGGIGAAGLEALTDMRAPSSSTGEKIGEGLGVVAALGLGAAVFVDEHKYRSSRRNFFVHMGEFIGGGALLWEGSKALSKVMETDETPSSDPEWYLHPIDKKTVNLKAGDKYDFYLPNNYISIKTDYGTEYFNINLVVNNSSDDEDVKYTNQSTTNESWLVEYYAPNGSAINSWKKLVEQKEKEFKEKFPGKSLYIEVQETNHRDYDGSFPYIYTETYSS